MGAWVLFLGVYVGGWIPLGMIGREEEKRKKKRKKKKERIKEKGYNKRYKIGGFNVE